MKVVSGGQTGVDQIALSVAHCLGFATGGWMPAGFMTEKGPLPAVLVRLWGMRECPFGEPEVRTEWNVRDSDATLIISRFPLEGGTLYTWHMVQKHRKFYLMVNSGSLTDEDAIQEAARQVVSWLVSLGVRVLNVAGPRQSRLEKDRERCLLLLYHVLKGMHLTGVQRERTSCAR